MGNGRVAAGLLALLSVVGGVGCEDGSGHEAGRPDEGAVVVDFYRHGLPSAACAGTLLSADVVLTAAHCTDGSDGARVTIAGRVDENAEVARVVTYDWTDEVGHHDEEHDLALLVLRRPLGGAGTARISTNGPFDAPVSLGDRPSHDGKFGVDVERVEGARLAPQSVVGRPFTRVASVSVKEAGGAVRCADGTIVGVVGGGMPDSAMPGASYVTPLDDPRIATWVRVVAEWTTAERAPASAGSVRPATLLGPELVVEGEATDPGATPGVLVGGGAPLVAPDVRPQLVRVAAPQPYDGPTGIATGRRGSFVAARGDNYWAADPGDLFFYEAYQFAGRHPEASFVMAHGNPGFMQGVPPRSELTRLVRSDRTTILISCFGGAVRNGRSNAARVSAAAGVSPERVWACTGAVAVTPYSLQCGGRWVDGNGSPARLPPNAPLQTCTMDLLRPGYASITNCR